MSVAKELRSFLMGIDDMPIAQVAQQHIPESYKIENGVIWFSRRGAQTARTFEQSTRVPAEVYFDVEIYHPSPDTAEIAGDLIQSFDAYHGAMGDGWVGAFLVDLQGDDYVPQNAFDDGLHLSSVFLSIEVRNYTEQ